MRIIGIIKKGFIEQLRSIWLIILTLLMGPFFIILYFLMLESTKQHYVILILNNEKKVEISDIPFNSGGQLMEYLSSSDDEKTENPFQIQVISSRDEGIKRVENRKADILVSLDSLATGSALIQGLSLTSFGTIELIGDVTSIDFQICSVFIRDNINNFVKKATTKDDLIEIRETPLGSSSRVNEFDSMVPGILVISIIMLMLTCSLAFVSEVEHRTIIRLKLSKITSFEFLGGIGLVQLTIGILSVLLTLYTANFLGFSNNGSFLKMIFIAIISCISMIAFSLIIAGFTRTSQEVLVVGNFPIIIFMFFTGAAFPLHSKTLFTIAGYCINIQGLMSPTHAISALKKILIFDTSLISVFPEILSILFLSLLYFFLGAILFKQKHLLKQNII